MDDEATAARPRPNLAALAAVAAVAAVAEQLGLVVPRGDEHPRPVFFISRFHLGITTAPTSG